MSLRITRETSHVHLQHFQVRNVRGVAVTPLARQESNWNEAVRAIAWGRSGQRARERRVEKLVEAFYLNDTNAREAEEAPQTLVYLK